MILEAQTIPFPAWVGGSLSHCNMDSGLRAYQVLFPVKTPDRCLTRHVLRTAPVSSVLSLSLKEGTQGRRADQGGDVAGSEWQGQAEPPWRCTCDAGGERCQRRL